MFFTFQGYGCTNGEYNDLAVLAFNPQVTDEGPGTLAAEVLCVLMHAPAQT
jgi:hypothetical protein